MTDAFVGVVFDFSVPSSATGCRVKEESADLLFLANSDVFLPKIAVGGPFADASGDVASGIACRRSDRCGSVPYVVHRLGCLHASTGVSGATNIRIFREKHYCRACPSIVTKCLAFASAGGWNGRTEEVYQAE